MSILSAQADELRTLSNDLRQLAQFRDLEQEERILCVASADTMNDAAETVEYLQHMQECHATPAMHERCKYGTDRGWCDTSRK